MWFYVCLFDWLVGYFLFLFFVLEKTNSDIQKASVNICSQFLFILNDYIILKEMLSLP